MSIIYIFQLEGFSKISEILDNCRYKKSWYFMKNLWEICWVLIGFYSIEELKDLDSNPEKLMKLIFDADLVSFLFYYSRISNK